ncbi:MAG TPA: citrate/2-methylcitrate synthase [Nitriliruptorales bacterium]|nr:citrate/2-methylcitrate synthase [Nitriliruptorales bacterium]
MPAGGLEGVVAAQTALSWIDGERGMLLYRGYPIDELARHATFEEVVHLLLDGTLPTRAQLLQVRRRLGELSALTPSVERTLRALPPQTTPMEALRTGVSLLGSGVPTSDRVEIDRARRDAYAIVARLPSVIGAFEAGRRGRDTAVPDPDASVAHNLTMALTGKEPDEETERAMDVALVLHAEHTLNASTFAARLTASTLSDIYSAVAAAVGALRGPLHGGANERVARMLDEIPSVAAVGPYIDGKLVRRERIMGFGHRVYRTEDPRAPHLREWAQRLADHNGQSEVIDKALEVQRVVMDRKGLSVNVDFFSAPLYTAMGVPRDQFTPIFAASRAAGWTAHVLEQQSDNRLIRPSSEYVGVRRRRWVPIDQRG